MTHVDLLALAACDTKLGSAGRTETERAGRQAGGVEVDGFGVLAQKQGAKAVLATLWKVADRSTGLFMQEFYRLRQERKLTKAEALSRAQDSFIRGKNFTKGEGVEP